jgi:hypothetical protein
MRFVPRCISVAALFTNRPDKLVKKLSEKLKTKKEPIGSFFPEILKTAKRTLNR